IHSGNRPVHCFNSVFKPFTSVNQISEYTASNQPNLFSAESDDGDWFRQFNVFIQQCEYNFECSDNTEGAVVFSAVIDSIQMGTDEYPFPVFRSDTCETVAKRILTCL